MTETQDQFAALFEQHPPPWKLKIEDGPKFTVNATIVGMCGMYERTIVFSKVPASEADIKMMRLLTLFANQQPKVERLREAAKLMRHALDVQGWEAEFDDDGKSCVDEATDAYDVAIKQLKGE